MGYRYDDHDAPFLHPSPSSTGRSDDGNRDIRSPHSNVFNHDAVHPDNEEDEKDEDGDENASESNPDVTGGHKRPDRGDMHLRLRMCQRWSRSDEWRLLACENKLGTKRDDIFRCFPGCTSSTVQARGTCCRDLSRHDVPSFSICSSYPFLMWMVTTTLY